MIHGVLSILRGIRKRAIHDSGTDYYASLRTAAALDRAEVALVVIDASEPLTEQDLRIVTMTEESGRALVLVMNKWDVVDEERREQLEKELDRNLERYPWAQRVNLSARPVGTVIDWPQRCERLYEVGRREFQRQNSMHFLALWWQLLHHQFVVASNQRFDSRHKQQLLHQNL